MKILAAMLLILLPDAFAFADDPAWWSDSKCRQERNEKYAGMVLQGWDTKNATERLDEEFKICICSAGDEVRIAVQALAESHEIEIMSGDRILTIPIKYGRDFSMMSFKGQCYLNVGKPELCKNSAFMSEARQSFNVHETYDEKSDLCVPDMNHFKG